MRLKNRHVGRWIFALCLVALSAACSHTDPEKALRSSVAGLQAAMDARDASAIEDLLAEDFVGPEGIDREGARRMAQLVFIRHQQVSTILGPLKVTMQNEHATVEFTAALTGGAGGLLPETGQLYDVQTGWRLRDGDWTLTSAKWTPQL